MLTKIGSKPQLEVLGIHAHIVRAPMFWCLTFGLNVSTTPLRQRGFRQCLPFSWTTLRGKHWWHPVAVMGVVDGFRHCGPQRLYILLLL